MKNNCKHIGLAKLCGWFGLTRQAYYKSNWTGLTIATKHELVLKEVHNIRKRHPMLGGRKLHSVLEPFFSEHRIKLGRDALFNLLAENYLLVKKRKRNIQTTFSNHWLRKYPNLIRNFVPTQINQLWVSDITYWKINKEDVCYLSLITDVYSHKIVGHYLAENLAAVGCVKSLKMALLGLEGPESHFQLKHHSDRGSQYCSQQYVKLLKENKIEISMTENGNPLENAVAERVNGILKNEYLECYTAKNIIVARKLVRQVVDLYNQERPHMSIGNYTPNEIHQTKKEIKTERLWKNYWQKKPIIVGELQD